uniref:Putative secreted protein n=1 Tax=Ixodes ricinus TaxID=34613 RepID=A0A147BQ76_IXORI
MGFIFFFFIFNIECVSWIICDFEYIWYTQSERLVTVKTRVSATEIGQFSTGSFQAEIKTNFEPQIVFWVVGLF